MFRAQDTGLDPRAITAEVTELWQSADSGRAFAAALEERGYILAKGDRRDFCIIDQAGDEHSLARRISGARAADVRARMVDIDRDSLPSVAEAREQYRATLEEQGPGERSGIEAEEAGKRELAADAEMEEAQFDRDVAPFVQEMRERGQIHEMEHGALSWWEIGAEFVARGARAVGRYIDDAREWLTGTWNHYFGPGPDDPDKEPDRGPDLG